MGDNVALPALAPTDIRLGQVLITVTTAVFIGSRFLPPRHRPIAERVMMVCYPTGAAILIAYFVFR